MIPIITHAELLQEDQWLVYIKAVGDARFPTMRLVPIDENPLTCPGGELWCKQFGCIPGDNVFTRSAPELLVEEGMEVPELAFEEEDILAPNWGGKGECWACDERVLHTEESCWENSPGIDH